MKNLVVLISWLFLANICYGQSGDQYPGCLDSLDIPVSVTPNGDRVSDVFSIYFPCTPQEFTMTIYNRWGVEVFKSDQPGFIWDGTDNKGKELEVGVYFFSLEFTYLDELKSYQGNIALIR